MGEFFQEGTRKVVMALVEQSSVIPFNRGPEGLKVILITARGDGSWIVPKGHLEPDMTPAESAEKEALEEAGVTGRLYPDPVFEYEFELGGDTIRVEMFLLEVDTMLDDWDEKSMRERRHVGLEEAVELVPFADLKKALRQLPEFLEQADKEKK